MNQDQKHYARQNTTRQDIVELQEAIGLRPDSPPKWYGPGAEWPEWLLAVHIDINKFGKEVGNNLKIGDVVWILKPPKTGTSMGIIVDFGKTGFVRLRNRNSSNTYDLERKPEFLLYNDRFQTGINSRGRAYRWDPRMYMSNITHNYVNETNAHIEELERKCKKLQNSNTELKAGNRILRACLNQAESKANRINNRHLHAKETIKALKQGLEDISKRLQPQDTTQTGS